MIKAASKKVVVTGFGVISPLGCEIRAFWENLIQGKSGISKIELFDTSKFNRHYGGEVKDFSQEKYVRPSYAKFIGRASVFTIAATKIALKDAGLHINNLKLKKTAVIIGVTIPEGNTLDLSTEMVVSDKIDSVTKSALLNIFSPSIASNLGYFLGLKDINLMIPNACSAGNYCIGYGYDLIRNGSAQVAIVGGSESLSRIAFQGFQRLFAMAPETCSPFDKNRKGMLLGEGSGILILESLESAKERKARIYAEVLGYGLSCDAHHMTAPKREGIIKAMKKAVINSGLSFEDIDYISAHGTGTMQNDKEEAAAINAVFNKKIPTSSIKSMLGHCMGAASAIEAIACILSIKNQIVPPTINFQTPDPLCDIDCVPNASRKLKIKNVLNNAFAFGGNNCCAVFSKLYE